MQPSGTRISSSEPMPLSSRTRPVPREDPPPRARSLNDLARMRIRRWKRQTGMSQTEIGRKIGRGQNWVSRYLAGTQEADLDTIGQLAAVFGRTVFAVLDEPSDPEEAEVIEIYRALPTEAREAVRRVLVAMRRSTEALDHRSR